MKLPPKVRIPLLMSVDKKRYINIHGHSRASSIGELVMTNLMAREFPPDAIDTGYYSIGFHPYSVGSVDEEETLDKVRRAVEHPRVLAVGETGLDKSIEPFMADQMRVFEKQVDIAENAGLPLILHVVRAFNEVIVFKKSRQPKVPMIIHGYQGGLQMLEELVKAGFLVSFGQGITREHAKSLEALQWIPAEKMFLETDEGDVDIRELYGFAAKVKGVSEDSLRKQLVENARAHLSRLNNFI